MKRVLDISPRAAAKTTSVPCNGCTLCCQGEAVILVPEQGDDPEGYATEPVETSEGTAFRLKQKRNGDCIYLVRGSGCSIWERRPAMCRTFSCIDLFKLWQGKSQKERKAIMRKGHMTPEMVKVGRAKSFEVRRDRAGQF